MERAVRPGELPHFGQMVRHFQAGKPTTGQLGFILDVRACSEVPGNAWRVTFQGGTPLLLLPTHELTLFEGLVHDYRRVSVHLGLQLF